MQGAASLLRVSNLELAREQPRVSGDGKVEMEAEGSSPEAEEQAFGCAKQQLAATLDYGPVARTGAQQAACGES
jgi:hypothetical protein